MVMKVIVSEEQKKGISQKLISSIDENGIMNTIKFVGGYDTFINILPDYFNLRQSKIDLIREIIDYDSVQFDGGGRIYLHELGTDILYDEFDGDEGYTFESYIDFIENHNDNLFTHVTVWEFDETGTMYDEYYDEYDVSINKLETKYLNKLFEMLVDYYLS
jgi:hypothetical protein